MADSQQKRQLEPSSPDSVTAELSSPESVTALSKVSAIPELFETILAHLPALEVLIHQRINSTWRNIIRKSSPLQEKLFFKCDLVIADVDNPWPSEDLLRLETNPFIQLLHKRQFLDRQNKRVHDHELGKLDYPEASWKKMYLTRPALCTIETFKKPREPWDKSSDSDFLVLVTQHDTIKMNHLRESCPAMYELVRFRQTHGIKMRHLQEMELSKVRLPTSRYCIRCIGALASDMEHKISPDDLPEQLRRLHSYTLGFCKSPWLTDR
ncbi:hypothetical protein JMJ35_003939 [Cladonia borealis]|uniref:F-box domain-containing protein n=1 Tax=Cladonia borealis TaxID=184061 RepID=A0AA39R4A8_9LECA|nr:hypothetical protein JMJ35_003939 [Cladonia borealis]